MNGQTRPALHQPTRCQPRLARGWLAVISIKNNTAADRRHATKKRERKESVHVPSREKPRPAQTCVDQTLLICVKSLRGTEYRARSEIS